MRQVCDWVEAVRHGEALLDPNLPLRSLWARIRSSCALPLCWGTSSFPTVTWPLLSESSLCRVAYVLLKEREPDLWDDEKVDTLSHSSLYTVSITLSFCIPSEPTIRRPLPCVGVTSWYCSLLLLGLSKLTSSADVGLDWLEGSVVLHCCTFFWSWQLEGFSE